MHPDATYPQGDRMNPTPKRVMRTREAAHYLSLSEHTLAKHRVNGKGPKFIKLGPKIVGYRLTDLDEWLAQRVRRSTAEC